VLATFAGMGSRMMAAYQSKAAGKRSVDLILALKQRFGRPGLQQQQQGVGMMDWAGIGAAAGAAGMWRCGPGVSSMLGPLHEEAKVRRVAQVRTSCIACNEVSGMFNKPLRLVSAVCNSSMCVCWLGSDGGGWRCWAHVSSVHEEAKVCRMAQVGTDAAAGCAAAAALVVRVAGILKFGTAECSSRCCVVAGLLVLLACSGVGRE
jgi:hypothetical protein